MTIDCTDQKNYYKSLLRFIFDYGGASLMASPYRTAFASWNMCCCGQ